MQIKYKNISGNLTVYLYGEVDECSCVSLRQALDNLLSSNPNSKRVIFDLSGVTFMDSTGIGLLIGRYKTLKQFNVPSYISGTSAPTERVLSLAGIYSIMPKI